MTGVIRRPAERISTDTEVAAYGRGLPFIRLMKENGGTDYGLFSLKLIGGFQGYYTTSGLFFPYPPTK